MKRMNDKNAHTKVAADKILMVNLTSLLESRGERPKAARDIEKKEKDVARYLELMKRIAIINIAVRIEIPII